MATMDGFSLLDRAVTSYLKGTQRRAVAGLAGESPANIKHIRKLVSAAHSRGMQIGGGQNRHFTVRTKPPSDHNFTPAFFEFIFGHLSERARLTPIVEAKKDRAKWKDRKLH